jgi:hypothetical protein
MLVHVYQAGINVTDRAKQRADRKEDGAYGQRRGPLILQNWKRRKTDDTSNFVGREMRRIKKQDAPLECPGRCL